MRMILPKYRLYIVAPVAFALAVCGLQFFPSLCSFLSSCIALLSSTPVPPDLCNSTTSSDTDIQPFKQGEGVSLSIWTKNGTRNDTAPYLPGILFEDIAHSGDGGIYAELIRNRAFQGSGAKIGATDPLLPGKVITEAGNPIIPFAPTLEGYYPIGDGVKLSLDLLHPLSDALQVVLQVDVPVDATGEVGFKNDGFWGIAVSPQSYNVSFYAQTNGFRWNATLTTVDVSLRDNKTDEVFVSESISLDRSNMPVPWTYNHYSAQLKCNTTAPTTNNALAITMSAEEARGQTFYFDLVSLFPETYKDRPNGLRKDLASALEDANFKFLRFPGGNNLEGYSIQRRWKWWETIGPLKDRPGRVGDWSYFNTDGLGLMEYMYWCEDMELVPVLGVYAGFSLDIANWDAGNSTDANELPISMMGPILTEALDELEFLMGSTDTYWGAKRAECGRPEPFEVPFVEIGNEDFFSHNYAARAKYMYEGLKAKYPNITYIYSAGGIWPERQMDITLPDGTIWDEHIYAPPQTFINHFDQFDNWQTTTNNTHAYASVMEYHAGGGHPSMHAAVAEAVYALGWERNPDIVKLACFAPLIQNRNVWRHTPYLALFDADPKNTVLSASYWQEWLFNRFRGEQTLPVTHGEGGFGPLFWVASIDESGSKSEGRMKVYLKVVNAGDDWVPLTVDLDVAVVRVNGTTLHAPDPRHKDAHNDLGQADEIVPRAAEGLCRVTEQVVPDPMEGLRVVKECRAVAWRVPPWSVSVLQIDIPPDDKDETAGRHGRNGSPSEGGGTAPQEILM